MSEKKLPTRYRMRKLLRRFFVDDEGAVSVDWIVLSAIAVGLAALAGNQIVSATEGLADGMNSYMSTWDH